MDTQTYKKSDKYYFSNILKLNEKKYFRDFVYALGNTSTASIKKLAARILPAFLDPEATQTVIVCNPAAVPDLIEEFKEFDIELTKLESLSDSYLID